MVYSHEWGYILRRVLSNSVRSWSPHLTALGVGGKRRKPRHQGFEGGLWVTVKTRFWVTVETVVSSVFVP